MKYREIFDDTKLWLRDSSELMFRRPFEMLVAFAGGEDPPGGLGQIAGSCWALARWYEMSFVVAANSDDSEAIGHLSTSLEFDLLDILIQDRLRSANPDTRFVDYLFRSHGLLLAKTAAIGNFAGFEWLGKLICENQKRDVYAGVETTRVAWLMLAIYRSFSGRTQVSNRGSDSMPRCYQVIAENWASEPISELSFALNEAADLHIAESKDDTNRRNYDFNEHFYRVFPAELIAVLQLRRSRKLSVPLIEHELMKLPTAVLIDRYERRADDLIEAVRARVRAEV